jgi:hypothetical protein
MATMKWTGQRHRGACSITEAPTSRRKYAGRRKPAPSGLDAHRMKEHQAELKAEAEALALFEARLDCIALKEIPFHSIQAIYRACFPRR